MDDRKRARKHHYAKSVVDLKLTANALVVLNAGA